MQVWCQSFLLIVVPVLEIKPALRKCCTLHSGPWERWMEYVNRNWTGFTEGLQGHLVDCWSWQMMRLGGLKVFTLRRKGLEGTTNICLTAEELTQKMWSDFSERHTVEGWEATGLNCDSINPGFYLLEGDKRLFLKRRVKHWERLPGEMLESVSREILKS